MEIYETIKYIFEHSNPFVVGSWGIEYFVPLFETEQWEGGAEIKVNGAIFTGKMRITLNWLDLWDIELLDDDGSTKQLVSGIYTDGLVMTIDGMVQTPLGAKVEEKVC